MPVGCPKKYFKATYNIGIKCHSIKIWKFYIIIVYETCKLMVPNNFLISLRAFRIRRGRIRYSLVRYFSRENILNISQLLSYHSFLKNYIQKSVLLLFHFTVCNWDTKPNKTFILFQSILQRCSTETSSIEKWFIIYITISKYFNEPIRYVYVCGIPKI